MAVLWTEDNTNKKTLFKICISKYKNQFINSQATDEVYLPFKRNTIYRFEWI